MRHEKGLVVMGDLVEPANLGVAVTTQQEVMGHLGGRDNSSAKAREKSGTCTYGKVLLWGRIHTSMAF